MALDIDQLVAQQAAQDAQNNTPTMDDADDSSGRDIDTSASSAAPTTDSPFWSQPFALGPSSPGYNPRSPLNVPPIDSGRPFYRGMNNPQDNLAGPITDEGIKASVNFARRDVSGTDGACLSHVENALEQGMFRNVRSQMPDRNGTHWAKDLHPVLANNPNFKLVAVGHGGTFTQGYNGITSLDDVPVGSVAVWVGGPFGHTEVKGVSRTDPTKTAWQFGYQSKAENWTGLANPESHGQFYIYAPVAGLAPVAANTQNTQPGTATLPSNTAAPANDNFIRHAEIDPSHVRDLTSAAQRFASDPRSANLKLNYHGKEMSWSAVAALIKAAPDMASKANIANDAINATFHYGNGTRLNWINSPTEMAHGAGVICGDLAAAKGMLLTAGEVPSSQISLLTVAPGSGYADAHVIASVTDGNQRYILELNRREGGPGYVSSGPGQNDHFSTWRREVTKYTAMPNMGQTADAAPKPANSDKPAADDKKPKAAVTAATTQKPPAAPAPVAM